MCGVYGTLLIDGRTDLNRGLASTSFVSKLSEQIIDSFDFDVEGQSSAVYVRDLETSLSFVSENKGICVGMCTDNCNTMRKTREDFAAMHLDILCYACTDHMLDLLMNYFAEATICAEVISRVKAIQNVFRKHSRILSALKTVNNYLLPCVPGETRWHYASEMMENYLANHTSLIVCSHLDEVQSLIEPYSGQLTWLYDATFTNSVKRVLELLEPFKLAIKDAESDRCPAEKVVDIWITLKLKIDTLPVHTWRSTDARANFIKKFDDHLMAISDGHLAAYYLHPRYDNSRCASTLKKRAVDYCVRKGINNDFLVQWFMKDYTCLGIPAPLDFVETNKTKSLKLFWKYCAAESTSPAIIDVMKLALRLDGSNFHYSYTRADIQHLLRHSFQQKTQSPAISTCSPDSFFAKAF